jgi:hypothetical protein
MKTLAPTFVYRHTRIGIATERPTQFVDLTDGLESLVTEAGLTVGFVNVQTLHTTTALVVNEHEPLLLGTSPRCSSRRRRVTASTATTTRRSAG